MNPSLVAVVTTIQRPTVSLRRLAARLRQGAAPLVVIGDRKGPDQFQLDNTVFLSLAAQRRLPGRLARLLPVNHYARKNLGYLWAMRQRPACIFETDDDNAPDRRWQPRRLNVHARIAARQDWLNVYRHFSTETIWPRGFPLQYWRNAGRLSHPKTVTAPIQQELADRHPDVDAIWRLVFGHDVRLRQAPSVCLPPGSACPFNSQATWWWPVAWPLLYLPSHCSFRMTDIWRSFIAQRCLWALGHGIVFHAPTVTQQRNTHDLTRDFHDEVPGYEHNEAIMAGLRALRLWPGPQHLRANLLACYRRLIADGFLPRAELPLVQAWLADLPA